MPQNSGWAWAAIRTRRSGWPDLISKSARRRAPANYCIRQSSQRSRESKISIEPHQQPGRSNPMTTGVIENERTAMSQNATHQPDGPGKRIGKKGEISGIGKVAPGGAKLFRERLPQIQAEAAYWETRVGTVHDFRVTLIDNDTSILFTIVYDGEFK